MLAGRPRQLAWLGAATYFAVLLSLTLAPAPPDDPQQQSPVWLNLRPFETIGRALSGETGRTGAALVVGNVAAFVPLGVLVGLLARDHSLPRVAGLGLGLSLAIESAQLALSLASGQPYRHADVDDVILNTTGALVGYALLRAGLAAGRLAEPRPSS